MPTVPHLPIPRVPFLYLRHGETDWNAAGRAQGRSDIPLNATGIAQAGGASALLAATRVDRIVASPLLRARETARLVAEPRGLPVLLDDALMEVCFGAMEGEPMGPWYEAWLAGDATPPGAESFSALVLRASDVLARHLAPPCTTLAGTTLAGTTLAGTTLAGTTLFVAHGALFRGIRTALGLPNDTRLANGVPLHCAPSDNGWIVSPVA